MMEKIAAMKQEASSRRAGGNGQQTSAIQGQINAARRELRVTFAKMKAQEKAEQARIRAEERAADHAFAEMVKHKELAQEKEMERQP